MIEMNSEAEMTAFGASFAKSLKLGDVVLLYGDLGVGKSVLARSIIRAWLNDDHAEIPSPSFTLVQNYQTHKGEINHYDLYRLGDSFELVELGLPEQFEDALSLVEWPARLGDMTPENAIKISIEDCGGEKRKLTITQGDRAWTP